MKPQRPDAGGGPIAVERSAYAAICALFERTYPSSGDLNSAHIAGAQMSIFEMPVDKIHRLFSAPFSASVFRQPFQHPTAAELGERILYLQLRYCLSCLKQGQHSALFQNALLQHCPVHGELLRTGCPRCGKRIPTTLESMREAPWHCNECGASFRTARQLGKTPQALPAEPFSGVRDLMGLLATPEATETSRGLLQWQYPSRELREATPDSALVRAAARHVDWRHASRGTPSWTQQVVRLKDMSNGEGSYIAGEVVVNALLEVKHMIQGRNISTDLPAERPWVYLRNHALNADMAAATVALCRTANAYGLLEYVVGDRRRPTFVLQVFGRLPDSAEGAAMVARFEVFGLFARCLGEAAETVYTDDVDWLHTPSPETFCPAWRLVRDGNPGGELHLRLLADWNRVARLTDRLGARRLELSRIQRGYITRNVPPKGAGRDEMLTAQRARRYGGRFEPKDGP